ncbi:MAG: 50S ribosomal protein L18, partial [Candidatus Kerfeldbacteria bacterium]|nr:50S ribosomal protein L18 [Candidatus Kerfeldbacteria bacterium]
MHRPSSSHHARLQRHRRIRAILNGTSDRPRLVVFRSLKHIEAQLVDDVAHKTLAAVSDMSLKLSKEPKAKRAA